MPLAAAAQDAGGAAPWPLQCCTASVFVAVQGAPPGTRDGTQRVTYRAILSVSAVTPALWQQLPGDEDHQAGVSGVAGGGSGQEGALLFASFLGYPGPPQQSADTFHGKVDFLDHNHEGCPCTGEDFGPVPGVT